MSEDLSSAPEALGWTFTPERRERGMRGKSGIVRWVNRLGRREQSSHV